MGNWVHLLGVHSQNMSFDEDDSEVNMTVSDGSESSSDDLDSADELYESFVRMMRRGKLPSIVHTHVYIYTFSTNVYAFVSPRQVCKESVFSHIQRAETKEMSKLTLNLTQVHNPGCHFAHLQGHSLSPSKWTMEKSVQQLPAGSSTSGGRMCNGFFVNYAIPGCMYTVNTLPSKNLS